MMVPVIPMQNTHRMTYSFKILTVDLILLTSLFCQNISLSGNCDINVA